MPYMEHLGYGLYGRPLVVLQWILYIPRHSRFSGYATGLIYFALDLR